MAMLALLFLLLVGVVLSSGLTAGVAKIDATPPIGVPLAGFNWGPRRVPDWPIPKPTKYTTFMMPSVGVLDPIYTKAVVLDDGSTRFAFVTLDGIGSDSTLNKLAYDLASGMGFNIPMSNVLFSSSHSHSGPGAVSPEFLWSMAPATDIMVPEVQRGLATNMAKAMVAALNNMQSAKLNITVDTLIGVTKNRRADISPYVQKGSIDPNLGIIRIDNLNGNPIATVWNFAIHGTCYGSDNMKFSADIMGKANELIETLVGGVSLFINADAGDISPGDGMCSNAPNFVGSSIIASAVTKGRNGVTTTDQVALRAASIVMPFGPTNLNLTLGRIFNCTHGGPINICTFCELVHCDENFELYSSWVENSPRFTALRFDIGSVKSVIGSMPGEALLELGWWLRNDTLAAGFQNTLLAGYSNSHMGYFCTPNEYDIGGYESELTMWGIDTAQKVRDGFNIAISKLL